MSRKPRPLRFTLVELLVVMTVISILAALLLPAIRSAMLSAKLIECMNSQRQLGQLIGNYLQDEDDQFPFNPGKWDTALNAYASDEYKAVKFCPYRDETTYGPYKPNRKPGWTYCMNVDLRTQSLWNKRPVKISALRWHSRTMLITDGGWRGTQFGHLDEFTDQTFFGRGSPYASPPHHNDRRTTHGTNITYVDGHCKFMKSYDPPTRNIAKSDRDYPTNYEKFWGREGTQSWNLAHFSD